MRLQTRISVIAILGMVLVFAFMTWEGMQAVKTATRMALDERLNLAHTVALHLDQNLERTLERLAHVAAFPTINLEDDDLEPEKAELQALYRPQLFSYVFLLDKDGLVLWTEPYLAEVVGSQRLECPHVQEALRAGQPAIACTVHTLTPQRPAIAPVVPIKNREGAIVGALGGAMDPSSPAFAYIFEDIAPGRTGYIQLVDENGIVLAHTQGRRLFQKSEHADFFVSLLERKEAAVATQTVTEEGRGTFREVIAFAPLTVAPWGVAVEQEEVELLAPALELRRQTILFGTATLAGVLLLAWLIVRSIVEPVRQLVAASGRIAAGDLATPVPPLGEDEIGELGRSFEEMRQRLAQWGEELERKVAERTRELSILYAIDRAAAQSLELDEILNDALEETLEVLEIEAGGILLMEPEGETMTLQVHRGLSEEFVQAVQRMKVREGISGQAVAEGKPVVLDVADYPTERLSRFVIQEGLQSLVSTPLVSKGVALGALTLGTRRPRAFPPEELDLLTAIGQHLGQAVENARLYEKERRLVTYLQHLNQATARANVNLQVDALAQVVTETLVEDFNAAFARLWVVDEAGENLVLRASAGLYTHLDGSRARVPIATDPRKLGVIARKRRPLITNTVPQDPHFDRAWAEREGLVAFAGYPVVLGDRLQGVLALFSRQPLDEEMLDVLGAFVNQVAVALSNARLFAERQQRIAELAALNQVGRALATTLHLDELLEIIYQEVTSVMEADASFIALYDRKANLLDYRIRVDQGMREPPERRAPGGLTGLIVSTGEAILIRDFEKEKDQYPQPRLWGTMKAPPSWLGVPMKVGEEVVGVISVQAYRPQAYDEGDLALLSTIATQAALAVDSARLFQESTQRLAELSALFEVSSALRGAATVEEMLPIILDKTVEVLQADTGALFRVDERTGELVGQAARGRLENLLGLRLGPTEGVCGYVAQTCAPYPFADLAADPHTGDRVQPLVKGVQGGVCVPLMTGERLVGTLIVGNYGPRTFSDDEVRLLTAIADMAASAIHRASLFEELQTRVRELTTVYEVGEAVTSTLRVEDVLSLVTEIASQALRAERCFLFLWDEQEERLVLRSAVGLPEEPIGQLKYRLGEGLSGWVFLEGRPANVPDVAADPRWKTEPRYEVSLPSGQPISALVVPLVVGEKTLGVLGVVNKTADGRRPKVVAFTPTDESLLTALAGQMAIAIENARLYEDVRGLSIATIRSLATAIDARDPYTKGHSDQVARLSVLLAREMGWNGADLEMLEFAALLHDVGKIGIPDAVLRKTEPPTPEEWNSIHLHPYHSAQIVKPVEPLQRIIPWIYHHQEWWDGTGYPDGLKGERIPLASRIIAVADAFNAMTTDRPYRKAKSREEAIEELRRYAGTQFDPRIVEVFVRLLEEQIDITGGGKKVFWQRRAGGSYKRQEEKLLFVKTQERGVPVAGGPIGVMLHEHDEGRGRVKAVAEALPQARNGEASALTSVRSNLLAYVELLWAHVDKEDNVLYPMADRFFTPEDQRALTEAFEKVEAEEIGEGVHERYHRLPMTWPSQRECLCAHLSNHIRGIWTATRGQHPRPRPHGLGG